MTSPAGAPVSGELTPGVEHYRSVLECPHYLLGLASETQEVPVASNANVPYESWCSMASNKLLFNVILRSEDDMQPQEGEERDKRKLHATHANASDVAQESQTLHEMLSGCMADSNVTVDQRTGQVIVPVPGVPTLTLHNLLCAIYRKTIVLNADNVEHLLFAATRLDIKCVVDACLRYLTSYILERYPDALYKLGKILPHTPLHVLALERLCRRFRSAGSNEEMGVYAWLLDAESNSPEDSDRFIRILRANSVSELQLVALVRQVADGTRASDVLKHVDLSLLHTSEIEALSDACVSECEALASKQQDVPPVLTKLLIAVAKVRSTVLRTPGETGPRRIDTFCSEVEVTGAALMRIEQATVCGLDCTVTLTSIDQNSVNVKIKPTNDESLVEGQLKVTFFAISHEWQSNSVAAAVAAAAAGISSSGAIRGTGLLCMPSSVVYRRATDPTNRSTGTVKTLLNVAKAKGKGKDGRGTTQFEWDVSFDPRPGLVFSKGWRAFITLGMQISIVGAVAAGVAVEGA